MFYLFETPLLHRHAPWPDILTVRLFSELTRRFRPCVRPRTYAAVINWVPVWARHWAHSGMVLPWSLSSAGGKDIEQLLVLDGGI